MSEHLRLVALLGSPRKTGNTGTLLEAALQGAREEGASVKTFWLRQMKITPCIGCNGCYNTGVCVVNDDMHEVYSAIDEADLLILASPVYFYSVSGFAKAAIDRFQPYWARKHILKEAPPDKRYAALISVGASYGKRLFEGLILTSKSCFGDAGFVYAGHVLIRGVEHPCDVERHPEHLEAAKTLGRLLVTEPAKGLKYEV